MTKRTLLPVLPEASIWSQIAAMRKQSRMLQAGLVVVPSELDLDPFLDQLLVHILCSNIEKPCASCKICTRVLSDTHPDIYRIQPENSAGAIKIEQIRALQTVVSQTPQWNNQQILILYPAEAMNEAAGSALLKILEEPNPSTLFILLSSNPTLLLPTLVSRCQQIHVQVESSYPDDPLSLGNSYPEHSARKQLYAQRLDLLAGFESVLTKRASPCDLAQQWSELPIQDLLWWFAAVVTKLIQLRLLPFAALEPEYQLMTLFTHSWRPENLYPQLDRIYAMLAQLQQGSHLNEILVWERLLLDFLEEYSRC